MIRSLKYLRAAQGQECMVRIPGICNDNPETVVAAHANWPEYGKGMGLKAHDVFTAWACSACHFELDQGKDLTYDERKHYWQRGFEQTLIAAYEQGLWGFK